MYLNKITALILIVLFSSPAQAFWFQERREQKQMLADAKAAYEQGDYRNAVFITQEFLLKNAGKHNAKSAYILIGNSYKALGAYDKALLKYNEAIEFYPKDAELTLALADIYFLGGLTDKAIEVYKRVLDLDEDNAPAKLGLAESYLSEGFFDRASKYFKEYIEVTETKDPNVYYDYALSRFYANDYAGALTLTQKTLSMQSSASATFLLAKIYRAEGKKHDSILAVNRALELAPKDEEILLTKMLWLSYEDDSAAQGFADANEYLKTHPNDNLALFARFLASYKLGNKKAALEDIKTVAQSEGDGFINKIALNIYKRFN